MYNRERSKGHKSVESGIKTKVCSLAAEFVYLKIDHPCLKIDFELKKKGSCSPLGNFADISYLVENFKPHLLRDVCSLCSRALVSDSL